MKLMVRHAYRRDSHVHVHEACMLLHTGLSDWADGYAAKRLGQSSVLGSYLDPLADKVLVGCTVGALAAEVGHLNLAPFSLSLCNHVGCSALSCRHGSSCMRTGIDVPVCGSARAAWLCMHAVMGACM